VAPTTTLESRISTTTPTNTGIEWYSVESVKNPLENRVWYNYPGQPTSGGGAAISQTYDEPTRIARVLDDGTTQLSQFEYNALAIEPRRSMRSAERPI
jgi:hypothetical protein